MPSARVGILSDTRLFSEGVSRLVGVDAALQVVDVGDADALLAAPEMTGIAAAVTAARRESAGE